MMQVFIHTSDKYQRGKRNGRKVRYLVFVARKKDKIETEKRRIFVEVRKCSQETTVVKILFRG